jgi:hypothetical protein
MSNYINIGEDQPFEWNIVPLSMYLYGVEDPTDRPVFGSFKVKHLLEERYRDKYLTTYCESAFCATSYKAEWREMVAATLIRSIFIFVVDTTVDQDREFIAEFNSLPNKNHFNGVTNNCADFARRVINTYFPHATNSNYINDFGMTSPKAIARSFTRYAVRHPEANFPNARITFDFGVRRREDTIIPGILIAFDRIGFIVGSKISNNSRVCRIGSTNFGLAVEKSIRLIEIDGLGDVGRDNCALWPIFEILSTWIVKATGMFSFSNSRASATVSEPPQLIP